MYVCNMNNQPLINYLNQRLAELKPTGIMNPFNDIKRELLNEVLEFVKKQKI